MKLRHHKNNRWFTLRFYREQRIAEGQRWTGKKMVPRSIQIKPGPIETVFLFGSDAAALKKAFCAYQNTNLVFRFVAPSTESEIANNHLVNPK